MINYKWTYNIKTPYHPVKTLLIKYMFNMESSLYCDWLRDSSNLTLVTPGHVFTNDLILIQTEHKMSAHWSESKVYDMNNNQNRTKFQDL